MKKATATGQRMLNITSTTPFTVNPGTVLGTGPGLKAKASSGSARREKTAEAVSNFLFISESFLGKILLDFNFKILGIIIRKINYDNQPTPLFSKSSTLTGLVTFAKRLAVSF